MPNSRTNSDTKCKVHFGLLFTFLFLLLFKSLVSASALFTCITPPPTENPGTLYEEYSSLNSPNQLEGDGGFDTGQSLASLSLFILDSVGVTVEGSDLTDTDPTSNVRTGAYDSTGYITMDYFPLSSLTLQYKLQSPIQTEKVSSGYPYINFPENIVSGIVYSLQVTFLDRDSHNGVLNVFIHKNTDVVSDSEFQSTHTLKGSDFSSWRRLSGYVDFYYDNYRNDDSMPEDISERFPLVPFPSQRLTIQYQGSEAPVHIDSIEILPNLLQNARFDYCAREGVTNVCNVYLWHVTPVETAVSDTVSHMVPQRKLKEYMLLHPGESLRQTLLSDEVLELKPDSIVFSANEPHDAQVSLVVRVVVRVSSEDDITQAPVLRVYLVVGGESKVAILKPITVDLDQPESVTISRARESTLRDRPSYSDWHYLEHRVALTKKELLLSGPLWVAIDNLPSMPGQDTTSAGIDLMLKEVLVYPESMCAPRGCTDPIGYTYLNGECTECPPVQDIDTCTRFPGEKVEKCMVELNGYSTKCQFCPNYSTLNSTVGGQWVPVGATPSVSPFQPVQESCIFQCPSDYFYNREQSTCTACTPLHGPGVSECRTIGFCQVNCSLLEDTVCKECAYKYAVYEPGDLPLAEHSVLWEGNSCDTRCPLSLFEFSWLTDGRVRSCSRCNTESVCGAVGSGRSIALFEFTTLCSQSSDSQCERCQATDPNLVFVSHGLEQGRWCEFDCTAGYYPCNLVQWPTAEQLEAHHANQSALFSLFTYENMTFVSKKLSVSHDTLFTFDFPQGSLAKVTVHSLRFSSSTDAINSLQLCLVTGTSTRQCLPKALTPAVPVGGTDNSVPLQENGVFFFTHYENEFEDDGQPVSLEVSTELAGNCTVELDLLMEVVRVPAPRCMHQNLTREEERQGLRVRTTPVSLHSKEMKLCLPCSELVHLPEHAEFLRLAGDLTGSKLDRCQWTCKDGFVKNGSTCAECIEPNCSVGEYWSACGECAPCLPLPAGSNLQYTTSGTAFQQNDTCKIECIPSHYRRRDGEDGLSADGLPSCQACTPEDLVTCNTAPTSPQPNRSFAELFTFLVPCSEEADTHCEPCMECGPGSIQLSPCTAMNNTVCEQCDPSVFEEETLTIGKRPHFTTIGSCEWDCTSPYKRIQLFGAENSNRYTCVFCSAESCGNGYYFDGICNSTTSNYTGCIPCEVPEGTIATSPGLVTGRADSCMWECVDLQNKYYSAELRKCVQKTQDPVTESLAEAGTYITSLATELDCDSEVAAQHGSVVTPVCNVGQFLNLTRTPSHPCGECLPCDQDVLPQHAVFVKGDAQCEWSCAYPFILIQGACREGVA